MRRRDLLRRAGIVAGAVGLSGCTGGPPTGDEVGTDDGTDSGGDGSDGGDDGGGGGEPTETTEEPTPAVDPDLDFLTQISVQPVPVLGGGGDTIERTYGRDASSQGTTSAPDLTLSVPETLYRYYRDRPRPASLSGYVADGFAGRYLNEIGAHFEGYTARTADALDGIAYLAQGFPAGEDSGSDRTQYPMGTLVDGTGDGLDASLLLVGIVRERDYPAVLLRYPEAGHVAAGIASDRLSGASVTHDGTTYYHTEAARSGYGVGRKPTVVFNQEPEVVPLGAAPSLGLDAGVVAPGAEGSVLDVDLTVHNAGTAPASGVSLRVAFEGVDGAVTAERTTEADVPADDRQTVTVPFRPADGPSPPEDRRQRLRATADLGGETRFAVTSDYFSPGG